MTTYQITVHTADTDGAGTDANVFIRLFGTGGHTREHRLDDPNRNDFERGATDGFSVADATDIGGVTAMSIRHDNTELYASWQLVSVRVHVLPHGIDHTFTINRTLEGGTDDRGQAKPVGYLATTAGHLTVSARSSRPSRSRWDQFAGAFEDWVLPIAEAVLAAA
jgi:hypothetical protein